MLYAIRVLRGESMRHRLAPPLRAVAIVSLFAVGSGVVANAQDVPESPFRCSVAWNQATGELSIVVENTSASPVLSDGVASFTLTPKAGAETRYWAPLNMEKGKAAVPGEEASLALQPKESRSLTVEIGALRWARQIRGVRPIFDSLQKIVPSGAYALSLRIASVACKTPEEPLGLPPR
jgi:hypothetical protein